MLITAMFANRLRGAEMAACMRYALMLALIRLLGMGCQLS
jgi:hypothetical protein